jgi:hypothetical protein
MDYRAYLIARARWFWAVGEPIPLDLAALMLREGLDVERLEDKHRNS